MTHDEHKPRARTRGRECRVFETEPGPRGGAPVGDGAGFGAEPHVDKRRLWHVAKRIGPFVLVGGLILYVIARPNVGPTGDEIPAYTVSTPESQLPETRLRIGRGRDARFALLLQPSKPNKPETKIVAYVFAMSGGESEPNPIDAKVDVGGDGVIRMSGSARLLEGASDLRVVIGAPSAFARFDDAAARAKSGKGDGFVQVTVLPIDRE
jgi:hypothetical protein